MLILTSDAPWNPNEVGDNDLTPATMWTSNNSDEKKVVNDDIHSIIANRVEEDEGIVHNLHVAVVRNILGTERTTNDNKYDHFFSDDEGSIDDSSDDDTLPGLMQRPEWESDSDDESSDDDTLPSLINNLDLGPDDDSDDDRIDSSISGQSMPGLIKGTYEIDSDTDDDDTIMTEASTLPDLIPENE